MTQDKERETAYKQWLEDNFLIETNWGDENLKPALPRLAFEHAWQAARAPLLADLAAAMEALELAETFVDDMNTKGEPCYTLESIQEALSRLSHYRKGV